MFKRHNQLFTALRVLLDMLLVGAAFWAAYALRFGSPRTWPYPELPRPVETLIVASLALIIWPLSLRALGLYRPQRQKTPLDEVFGVFKADRKSTRLNSSHGYISYAVFCLKKKKKIIPTSRSAMREIVNN